jgi:hypothetical protein
MTVIGTQRIVRGSGFNPGPSNDGIYGTQTRNAVLAYQQGTSWITQDDGVVGRQTWNHMANYKLYTLFNGPGEIRYGYQGGGEAFMTTFVGGEWHSFTRNINNSNWVCMCISGPA